jgi:prolyl-tRNA synthetase
VGVNPARDLRVDKWVDLRKVDPGDLCTKCGNPVELFNAIEVGHIFKLGEKYSHSMKATYLDDGGKERSIVMGSYGIGLERIMGACIDVYHDGDGICWPVAIAPFKVVVVPLNVADTRSKELGERIYDGFTARGVETLLDDRDNSPGFKFKDADLIGIPYRVTIGEKSLKEGKVEIYERKTKKVTKVSPDRVVGRIERLVCSKA